MNVNPDILNNDWVTTSRQLIRELFEFAGIPEEDFPKWLDRLITENGGQFSDTDLEEDRHELVRSALLRYINDTWNKQRYEYEKYETSSLPQSATSMAMRIQWLVETNKLSGFFHHKEKGVCMTSSIIDVLKPYGLGSDDRIMHKTLADLGEFEYDTIKLNRKSTKAVFANIEK